MLSPTCRYEKRAAQCGARVPASCFNIHNRLHFDNCWGSRAFRGVALGRDMVKGRNRMFQKGCLQVLIGCCSSQVIVTVLLGAFIVVKKSRKRISLVSHIKSRPRKSRNTNTWWHHKMWKSHIPSKCRACLFKKNAALLRGKLCCQILNSKSNRRKTIFRSCLMRNTVGHMQTVIWIVCPCGKHRGTRKTEKPGGASPPSVARHRAQQQPVATIQTPQGDSSVVIQLVNTGPKMSQVGTGQAMQSWDPKYWRPLAQKQFTSKKETACYSKCLSHIQLAVG